MHNHVNTKGITVSNELDLIKDAEKNSLVEFLSGLAYAVCGLVVVRKAGSKLEVEADPFNWLVAATPLNDELDLIALKAELTTMQHARMREGDDAGGASTSDDPGVGLLGSGGLKSMTEAARATMVEALKRVPEFTTPVE